MTRMKILIAIIVAFVLTIFAFDKNDIIKSCYLAQLFVSDTLENVSGESTSTDGSIIAVANLHTARAAHTATLLQDGTVLICGGFAGSSSNSLSSAEIYNPSSKSFTQISDLTTPRVGHSATLLPTGKVLIAGGFNGNYLSTTEIYDPELKTFSSGPNMNDGRHGHTATLLNNGKILFTGGVGTGWTFLSSAEIYDIQTNKFIRSNSMAVARESHTATLLKNGNVLITGGHQGRQENVTIYSGSEIYDSKTNQFTPTGNMNIPRRKHDAVLLADGKVLIHGGSDRRDSIFNSAEIYDPTTSLFSSIANMNYPRYKHKEMSILMPDDNVLILGGSDKAEIYNAKTEKFIRLQGNLGATRLFSCATLFDNGEILITGGYDQNITAISEARLFVKEKR